MTPGLHVVLDLETLSTRRNASITAIGAVAFHWPMRDGQQPGFHIVVDPALSPESLHLDPGTISWWMRQTDAARDIYDDAIYNRMPLVDAIRMFNKWVDYVRGENHLDMPVFLWGDGSDFDCTILENAAREVGVELHSRYSEYRDCRTVRALAQAMFTEEQLHVEPPQGFIEHRADHDAAYAAMELVNHFKLLEEQCKTRKREAVSIPVEPTPLDSFYPIPELMARFRDEGVTGNNLCHWQCRFCNAHITVPGNTPPYLRHYHQEWADHDAAVALVGDSPEGGATPAYVNQG
jgi:hypothetical protein